jgi:hypothetical protein
VTPTPGLLVRLGAGCGVALLLVACSGGGSGSAAPPSPTSSVPAEAPARVCATPPAGPEQAPAGAVRIDPAVVADLDHKTRESPAGTTFWLAPGTHRLGDGQFDQVRPKDGNVYLGAPGAVLDGGGHNAYAFVGEASGVTVSHLTVRGFVAPQDQGVVNHDSGARWVIEDNLLEDNRGAATMAGPGQVLRGNCLKDNGQYGLNAYGKDLRDLTVTGNEFVGNNADDLEKKTPGCGCTGGMKFWQVDGADVRDNWIHGNHGPGVWADTNNNDFLIEHNLIEDNDGPAIFYEISYNAVIRDNLIRRNNLASGAEYEKKGDTFPVAAIYLSEAGGEPRVKARTAGLEIYRNVLEDNWGGVTLWENADRFCNSPANTSTGDCTLLVPRTTSCVRPGIAEKPLYDDCRWKTQHVAIHDNRFSVDPRRIDCTSLCSRMAVLSNVGTYPDWSPYMGEVIQQAITFHQDNRWFDNTYVGPWVFTPVDPSARIGTEEWQAAPYGQDKGSTFSSNGATVADPTAVGAS